MNDWAQQKAAERVEAMQVLRDRVAIAMTAGAVLVLVIAAMMVAFPLYNVWRQGLQGEALLKRAQQEEQILVDAGPGRGRCRPPAGTGHPHGGRSSQGIPRIPLPRVYRCLCGLRCTRGASARFIYVPTEDSVPIIESPQMRAAGK